MNATHDHKADMTEANARRPLAHAALTAAGFTSIVDTAPDDLDSEFKGIDMTAVRLWRNRPGLFNIEHKAREGYPFVPRSMSKPEWANDLVLETWSDIAAGYPGWTWDDHKESDIVLWTWDDGSFIMLPYAPLREAFKANKDWWKKRWFRPDKDIQHSRKWRNGAWREFDSETVKVPIDVVVAAIKSAPSYNRAMMALCGWAA